MEALEMLFQRCGRYTGHGLNHQHQSVHGELEPTLGERGLQLWLRAIGHDGAISPEERCLIGVAPEGGVAAWTLPTSAPGGLHHDLQSHDDPERTAVHGEAEDTTVLREKNRQAQLPDGAIPDRYAWGLPGGPFAERSSVRMPSMVAP